MGVKVITIRFMIKTLEFILERNHLNVMYAEEHLLEMTI